MEFVPVNDFLHFFTMAMSPLVCISSLKQFGGRSRDLNSLGRLMAARFGSFFKRLLFAKSGNPNQGEIEGTVDFATHSGKRDVSPRRALRQNFKPAN